MYETRAYKLFKYVHRLASRRSSEQPCSPLISQIWNGLQSFSLLVTTTMSKMRGWLVMPGMTTVSTFQAAS